LLAPGDFLPLMDQLTFDPEDDTSQDCATVFIENDVILEDVERFSSQSHHCEQFIHAGLLAVKQLAVLVPRVEGVV